MASVPVVFLVFNRPELTARSFEAIRAARPGKLLLVADGPRADRAGEADLCARVRAVIDKVDWRCEVLRNYAEANMGCGRRVSSGLDWAFAQVEEAIVLEDDCLPDPSFFPYCAELLERYRGDERVMMIHGDNFQSGKRRTPHSYYFSRLPHLWGWATWRRAWQHYDWSMTGWPQRRQTRWLKPIAGSAAMERILMGYFDDTMSGKIDSWDYQWTYCMFVRNGFSIAPCVNLIKNTGFAENATRTLNYDDRLVLPSRAMDFPLRHPPAVVCCDEADTFELRYLNRLFFWDSVKRIQLTLILRALLLPFRPILERLGVWKALRALRAKVAA
jgi:hypothetical protein